MFETVAITMAGIKARNKAIAEKGAIEFTAARVGAGKPTSADDVMLFTQLIEPKLGAELKSSIAKAEFHEIVVLLDNGEVEKDFIVHELGIFAKTAQEPEFLYAYAYSEHGLYVPAKNARMVNEIVVNTTISQTAEVTIEADDRNVYITMNDLRELFSFTPLDGGTFFEVYSDLSAEGGIF